MKIIIGTPVDSSDFVAEVPTYMGAESFHLFAIGFLEMAEIAAERAVQNRCSIDAVIPAILYSLRHSVELFFKYLIYDLRIVVRHKSVTGHKILEDFETYRASISLALEVEPETGFAWRGWLVRFDSLIRAAHDLDPDGQAIRYPSNTKLVPNQGGGYAISTKRLSSCLAEMRQIYQDYDQRRC